MISDITASPAAPAGPGQSSSEPRASSEPRVARRKISPTVVRGQRPENVAQGRVRAEPLGP